MAWSACLAGGPRSLISSVILRPPVFSMIRLGKFGLTSQKSSHQEQLVKIIVRRLCLNESIDYSNPKFFKSLARAMAVKCDAHCQKVFTKLFSVLCRNLDFACQGWSCQSCMDNADFILDNSERIRHLILIRRAKSRLKKRHLLPLLLLLLPVATWFSRKPLAKFLSKPLSEFANKKLTWILPLLAGLLAILGMSKLWPKKPEKPEEPPSEPKPPPKFCDQCTDFKTTARPEITQKRLELMDKVVSRLAQQAEKTKTKGEEFRARLINLSEQLKALRGRLKPIEQECRDLKIPDVGATTKKTRDELRELGDDIAAFAGQERAFGGDTEGFAGLVRELGGEVVALGNEGQSVKAFKPFDLLSEKAKFVALESRLKAFRDGLGAAQREQRAKAAGPESAKKKTSEDTGLDPALSVAIAAVVAAAGFALKSFDAFESGGGGCPLPM